MIWKGIGKVRVFNLFVRALIIDRMEFFSFFIPEGLVSDGFHGKSDLRRQNAGDRH
jgi:hypothetical protein